MKEVTKDDFYQVIGPLNVMVSTIGDYPYTSEFRLKDSNILIGRVIPRKESSTYPYFINHYYLYDKYET